MQLGLDYSKWKATHSILFNIINDGEEKYLVEI
jgi:hypothetical protein